MRVGGGEEEGSRGEREGGQQRVETGKRDLVSGRCRFDSRFGFLFSSKAVVCGQSCGFVHHD